MKRTKLGYTAFMFLGLLLVIFISELTGFKGDTWICNENGVKVVIVLLWYSYIAPFLYNKFTVEGKQDGV